MKILDIAQGVRQNHALEHATIHVLSWRNPYIQIVGRSTPRGFVIYGPLELQEVAGAASEALARLQRGEDYLAVHPRCGTNLVVTSVLAGTSAFVATLGRPRSKLDRLPLVLVAATVATIAARPLGHRIQEMVTTTPEVDGVYIASVTRHDRGKLIAHRVVTGRE
jgi:hypothetical protein